MANVKISNFTDGVEAQADDVMGCARGGTNVKLPVGTMSGQNADNVNITGGSISLTMGSGSGTGQLIQRYDTQTTGAGNIGGGEDDLLSVTLPANTLNAADREVANKGEGAGANNNNPKTIKAYLNGTLVGSMTLALSLANQSWWDELMVTSTGTNSQLVTYKGFHESSSGAVVGVMSQSVTTENDNATMTIKRTATVTDGGSGINDNDATQTKMTTDFC